MSRFFFLPLSVCLMGPAPSIEGAELANPKFDVQVIKDVAYNDGPGAHKVRHQLDLYLPKGQKDFPVLFFVHGGAWQMGDKNSFGLYPRLGRAFAQKGIALVVINYRLTPEVKHPEHIKDVARAFAWTHKNIARYGGRPDQLFVCGHSAGGHLVALLATDESYLREHNLKTDAVRGVIPISGVYMLPPMILENVFGKDDKVLKEASPMSHTRTGLPPFLIIYADSDLPGCDKAPSEAFCKALKAKGVAAGTREITKRNHISIILEVTKQSDPAFEAISKFIAENSLPKKTL